MVTITEWKIVTDRWKMGMRPLKIQDQEHGRHVIDVLEKYKGNEFASFDDPMEAITLVLLIDLMKKYEKRLFREFDP